MNNTPQWAVECFCGGTVTLRAYTCEPVTLSPVSLCKFDMTNTVEIRRQIVVTPINIALTVADVQAVDNIQQVLNLLETEKVNQGVCGCTLYLKQ